MKFCSQTNHQRQTRYRIISTPSRPWICLLLLFLLLPCPVDASVQTDFAIGHGRESSHNPSPSPSQSHNLRAALNFGGVLTSSVYISTAHSRLARFFVYSRLTASKRVYRCFYGRGEAPRCEMWKSTRSFGSIIQGFVARGTRRRMIFRRMFLKSSSNVGSL